MSIHHDFNEIVYARFGTLVVVYGILLIIRYFLEFIELNARLKTRGQEFVKWL